MRQKCQIVEPDDTNSFCAAVDGGGWQVIRVILQALSELIDVTHCLYLKE